MSTTKYAKGYINRGIAIVPVPAKNKRPVLSEWQNLRIGVKEVPRYFNGKPQNIGILLGEPSGWVVDVDLDVLEAANIAGRFLPSTLTSGRESAMRSHWWYRTPGAKTEKWKNTDGEMLVELRSTGCQTVVEPSVHPSGERYIWHRDGGSGIQDVSADRLLMACRELATATLIARHLPPEGGRHDYALALAGYLLRSGRLDEDTSRMIMLAAWHAAEADSSEAVRDLEGIVRDTARNLAVGREVVGGPTLAEAAPGVPELLAHWWGWTSTAQVVRVNTRVAYDGREPKYETTPTTPSTPIPEGLPSASAFPVSALPAGCKRFVREATAAIGCPPELVAVPLLATLSAGIGASRVVELKGDWRESAALFLAVVSPPGTKKTPAAKAATAPVWKMQLELKKEYLEEREAYEEEFRQWEVDKRAAVNRGEAAPRSPDEPRMKRTVVEDTTVEALQSVLEANPRGVLVAKDELAGWVRSMDQYKGGKGADRQFWLSVWNNSPTSVDRKGKAEPTIIPRPWVSVVGGIQPAVLPELADARDDGLLDRFLLTYPEPRRTRLSDAEISPEASEQFKNLYSNLASLEMKEGENGEPVPGVVPMSHDDWELFKELSGELQDEMHAPGFPARLEGVWSKVEAYLARLSLILALCRIAESEAKEQVEAKDVLAAWVLLEYFKAHARRVHVGLHGRNPEDLLAEDLARFLQERGGEWNDEPNVLHEELTKRKSEAVPERPDELSKMVLAIAKRGTWLRAERGWGKKGGESCRMLHLRFRNGVDGVVGVDPSSD